MHYMYKKGFEEFKIYIFSFEFITRLVIVKAF